MSDDRLREDEHDEKILAAHRESVPGKIDAVGSGQLGLREEMRRRFDRVDQDVANIAGRQLRQDGALGDLLVRVGHLTENLDVTVPRVRMHEKRIEKLASELAQARAKEQAKSTRYRPQLASGIDYEELSPTGKAEVYAQTKDAYSKAETDLLFARQRAEDLERDLKVALSQQAQVGTATIEIQKVDVERQKARNDFHPVWIPVLVAAIAAISAGVGLGRASKPDHKAVAVPFHVPATSHPEE